MQVKLLFFTEDTYFLKQASDYFSRTQRDIEVHTYNNIERAKEFLMSKDNGINVILADGNFFENEDYPNIMKIRMSNRTSLDKQEGFYEVNVYQKAQDLVRDLKKVIVEEGVYRADNLQDASRKEDNGCIISFFSIQGGAGQSTLSHQIAIELARNCKVLLLSFDFINVYEKLYRNQYVVEFSKLMFRIKDRQSNPDLIFKSIVKDKYGFYVLPPFQTVGDIVELAEEDMEFLLLEIQKLNEFDYILLDLGHELNNLNKRMMEMSRKVISVYTADIIGQTKQSAFVKDPYIDSTNLLHKMEFVTSKVVSDITDNTQALQLPFVSIHSDVVTSFSENKVYRSACLALKERI